MPQLDSVTFLSQVFWLSIGFFIFYIIVVKNIIPSLGRMLKVRTKKVVVSVLLHLLQEHLFCWFSVVSFSQTTPFLFFQCCFIF